MASRPYNLMSLCAGVGGLELGVRIARPGARGVCYLEREVPAAARLVARMQDGSLHPAQAQSVLRRLDAWLAQRVDRLRAGGNGVSSLAAALAWRTLEASLAADLGRSTQPIRLKDLAA